MGRGFESLLAYYSVIDTDIMVGIAQLVSASDCGSEGRGFESHYPPCELRLRLERAAYARFFQRKKEMKK